MSAQNAGSDIGYNIQNEVQSIFAANDVIDTPAEDFVYRYGSNRNVPTYPLFIVYGEKGQHAQTLLCMIFSIK